MGEVYVVYAEMFKSDYGTCCILETDLNFKKIQMMTYDDPLCREFNSYCLTNWIESNYPFPMWNYFRAEQARTNNVCEGYNSRLKKRCSKPHLSIFEMIMVLQKEHIHIENGQQPLKKQKRDETTNSRLYNYGLKYDL